MSKTRIISLCLAVLCLLSACGSREDGKNGSTSVPTGNPAGTPAANAPSNASADGDSAAVWDGLGGFYALEAAEMPENVTTVTSYGSELYYVTLSVAEGSEPSALLRGASDTLYTTQRSYINSAAVCEDGTWIAEFSSGGGGLKNLLRLISDEGEVLKDIDLNAVYNNNSLVRSVLCSGENLFVIFEHELAVLDGNGSLICAISLPAAFTRAALGNDGEVYISETATNGGNDVSRVDAASASLIPIFSVEKGDVYAGNESFLLILEAVGGLYGIVADGSASPIAIWDECGISAVGLRKLVPLPDNKFFMLFEDGAYMLTPDEFSSAKVKTKLVIASVDIPYGIQQSAARFNYSDSDYYVNIVDYTEGGVLTQAEALMKLNTEMLSGKFPDMICFMSISPHTYIARGYLADLREYFDSDDDMSVDDIAIANALDAEGGMYYIGKEFVIETTIGLHSRFGDRHGWTLDEYLEIERTEAPKEGMLYNITRESFLRRMSENYIGTAIDWINGTCDFDNQEFIEILEASSRVRENPEDIDNMVFGLTEPRVVNGSLIGGSIWVNTVWALAFSEDIAGSRLSFIGRPTVDGSCGSNFILHDPVGIVSQSPNGNGCWEFIKFMLTDVDTSADNGASARGMPVYLPMLKLKSESAKTADSFSYIYPREVADVFEFSDEDEERFFALLAEVRTIGISDETVLKIIEEESAAMFTGQRTAADTARIIQSRVGIYVAEQS